MLALIAGEGALPRALYDALGGKALACELDGFPSGLPDPRRFRIETLGSFLAGLVADGVTEVCFAGAIRRPPIDPSKIDAATMPLVPRLAAAIGQGDDAALRAVLGLFEEQGLTVRAAQDLAPDLLAEDGVLAGPEPGERDRKDAARAAEIHAALAKVDVGQACVVAAGQALAVETLGGTDWMLATLAGDRRPPGAGGGVFYKAPKPGQDRRVDLPVIGPGTVAAAAAAGLSGLVIEAQGVMILDRAATLAACAETGLFLWARSP